MCRRTSEIVTLDLVQLWTQQILCLRDSKARHSMVPALFAKRARTSWSDGHGIDRTNFLQHNLEP